MKQNPISFPGFEDAARDMADFFKHESQIQEIEKALAIKIEQLKGQYLEEIAYLQSKRAQAYARLKDFALKNPLLFANHRRIEFAHGQMGFKKAAPVLVKQKGLKTKTLIKQMKMARLAFVRTHETLDIDKLTSKALSKQILTKLASIGLKVQPSEDEFYVEIKKLSLKSGRQKKND